MNRLREKNMSAVFLIAALTSILAVGLICLFLFVNGIPAMQEIGLFKFLLGKEWSPADTPPVFGILPMIVGSLYVTAGAIIIGVPIGILTAVFLARVCPKKLHKAIKPGIDLLAGIPSVVYGFFGMAAIVPFLGNSILSACILLGIMILPTIIGVAESAIRAVPDSYYEGALALGAGHYRSVFFVMLPAAKSGLFAAVVLGVGRAIGETMAVIMVAGNQARMLYDELAPFIKTITEQRESISRQISDLQHRSDIISAIMDNINEGIILTDKRGVILSANKSVLRIFEIDYPVDGKNTLEFLRDVEFSEYLRSALAGKHGEMGMEHADRSYRIYFSHVNGGGAIILFLDTTERAIAEKMRREFSANVSHELKTPLTSIYGNAEMLSNGIVKDGDKERFYGEIKNEAGRLIALIEDILMISKLDEGGGQELFEDVDLVAIAAETVLSLSHKATENKVDIRVSGESIIVKANRSLMFEMFYNLIDNAIKYNKPGGTVNADVTSSDSGIKITVSDTGIGIPKEAQNRVFERFYRVDKSRSKKTGGTGLGLAIVKHIVMVHNGKIALTSRVNGGTSITIILGDTL